jgi:hypothetical protein
MFSGNGAATEHHWVPVPAGAPLSAIPRFNLSRPF